MGYQWKRCVLCGLALAMWASTIGFADTQEACNMFVEPGESIQAAIDAAPEGAVICLPAGKWHENIVISRSLVLRGEDADSVVLRSADPDTPRISVRAPDEDVEVVIENIMIVGTEGDQDVGIWVQDGSHVVVANCVIAGNRSAGIWLADAAEAMISGCTVRGQDWYGGIRLSGSSQATIEDSVITDNALGITLTGASRATVRDSVISYNRWVGLSIRAASSLSIIDCEVVGNGAFGGVFVRDSGNALVSDCTIAANYGPGLQLADSAQATIVENTIWENGRCGVSLRPELLPGMSKVFTGCVTGFGNAVPGPDEEDGNREGAVCPEELLFLVTDKGGEHGTPCLEPAES